MSPVTPEATGLDWLEALGLPALLVSGSYLGAISHALTAIETLRSMACRSSASSSARARTPRRRPRPSPRRSPGTSRTPVARASHADGACPETLAGPVCDRIALVLRTGIRGPLPWTAQGRAAYLACDREANHRRCRRARPWPTTNPKPGMAALRPARRCSGRSASSTAISAPARSTPSRKRCGPRSAGAPPTSDRGHGRRLADPLVADPDRLDQVRGPDPARRQSRRGRHRGDAGAARRPSCQARLLAGVLLVVGLDRRGPPLRRRRDHAGDLGAQRRRGPEGRGARPCRASSCRSPWRSWSGCSWSRAGASPSSAASSGR